MTYPCQNLRVRQQAGELGFNAPTHFGHVLKNEGSVTNLFGLKSATIWLKSAHKRFFSKTPMYFNPERIKKKHGLLTKVKTVAH